MAEPGTGGLYGLGGLMDRDTRPTGNPNSPLFSGFQRPNNNINDIIANRDQEEYRKRFIEPEIQDRFQIEAKLRIINGQDTFLSIPPSRGKTSPIIGGFRIVLKRYLLGKTKNPPLLLYVVPRTQLAGQVVSKDILEDIILKIINPHEPKTTLPEETREGLDTSHLFNHYKVGNEYPPRVVRDLLDMFVVEIAGGSGGNLKFKNDPRLNFRFNYKPIIVATYESAAKNIPSSVTHIIIDEVQELVPHPNESTITTEFLKRYDSLVTLLHMAPMRSSITLMTGSINNISVKRIAEYFNNQYGRTFKVVPEFSANLPSLNRSSLVVQPLQSMAGFGEDAVKRRIELCKNIIINKQNKSLMIIFSKSKSGQGIFKIISELIRILPPRPERFLHSSDDNPEKFKINPFKNDKRREISDIEYLKYFNIDDIFSNSRENSAKEPDENNILYQAVLRGVAPVIGSMDQFHKKTVQRLFTKDRIQLILATDALGVGANVECRYFYIPSASKFDGGKLSKIDESSLTQLIHRAGRGGPMTGKIASATIYCSIEDFEYINNLVFNDPRKAVPELNPYLMNDLEVLYKNHGATFIKKILAKALFS